MFSPIFDQITSPPQTAAEVIVNEALLMLQHLAVYAVDPDTTTGLTLGYKGSDSVRWGGFTVADGTVALTASSTNYVVVNRSTGAVSVSTATTNWDDQATYARVYKLPTTADAINWATAEDHRSGPGGVHGQAVNAGGLSDGDYGDIVVSGGGAALNIDSSVLSAFGRNLIDDADAATARATLGVDAAIAAAVAGLSWKQAVRAATTAAGTLSSSFANGSVIDGVTLATGDRILVKNQASAAENGIYVVVASGAPTRATDADAGAELVNASVYVSEGTTLADTQWTCSTNAPITVGSTSLTFVQLTSGGGGGLTNWTDGLNSSSPNATTPVASLTATNAATNVDAAIVPKGDGAIMAQVPNASASGGNKRGGYATDLQRNRATSGQVSSGQYSIICGGYGNTASGQYAIVYGGQLNEATQTNAVVLGGTSNSATGIESMAGGSGNIASSTNATAIGGKNNYATSSRSTAVGGEQNNASGNYASIFGGYRATVRGAYGAEARANGYFVAVGDAQRRSMILRSYTTNATQTAMTADGGAASTTNQLELPNASAFVVTGSVVARQNTTGDAKTWTFSCAIKRGANAASTAMVAACTPTVVAADSGASAWSLAVEADTTNGSLTLKFTGEASKTILAVANINSVEVVG